MSSVESMLGGGGNSLKFPSIGTKHVLHVTDEPEVMQQRDFDSGEPLYWDDAKTQPRNQLVIRGTVDGEESTLYAKSGILAALKDAIREAGVKAPKPGGVLTIAYVEDGPRKGKGMPPKVYKAKYEPGQGGAAADLLASTPGKSDPPFHNGFLAGNPYRDGEVVV
jgi:hypothetical protein